MADHIKFTIGAAKGASVDRVFRDIRRDSHRIGSELGKYFNRSAKGVKGYRDEVSRLSREVRAGVKAEEELGRARRRQMSEAEKAARREAAARQYVHRLRMRQMRQEDAALQRQQRQQERSASRFARMTSHRATRFFWPNAPLGSLARRAAGDIARGIGVDLSGASALQSSVSNQAAATKLSNAAVIANDPRNAQRVDPTAIVGEAQNIGAKYNYDPSQVIEGLNQYTKRTGDLASGREMLTELSRIAAATGSEIDQLFGTAGELANQLTDIAPDQRSRSVIQLLKSFAGQGKLGAVELEDLSRYGARIAATAGLYEGDRATNITKLGALAQASRAFGGADTPAMAATSVARLATTFKTKARAQAFENITGKSVFGEGGKIRDPIELIKEAVAATNGDPLKWNKIFMNVMGERAAGGLASKYREAYSSASGTEEQKQAAGFAGIDKFMVEMESAALSEKQISDNIDKVSKTYEAQVNALNVKFQQIATRFLDKLLPKLEQAAPAIEEFAEKLSDIAIWIVENPKKAIAAGIGLSIARAGIESVLRVGLEKAMGSALIAEGAAKGLSMGLAAAGPAGVIAAAIAAAIAAHELGKAGATWLQKNDPAMKGHNRSFSDSEIEKDWEDAKLLFSRDKNFWQNLSAHNVSEAGRPEGFTVNAKSTGIQRGNGSEAQMHRLEAAMQRVDRRLSGTLSVRVEQTGKVTQHGDN